MTSWMVSGSGRLEVSGRSRHRREATSARQPAATPTYLEYASCRNSGQSSVRVEPVSGHVHSHFVTGSLSFPFVLQFSGNFGTRPGLLALLWIIDYEQTLEAPVLHVQSYCLFVSLPQNNPASGLQPEYCGPDSVNRYATVEECC